MTTRALTDAEIGLARSVFGDAINYAPVRIHQRKWAFFQPRNVVMAPDGDIWFHPRGNRYRVDFAASGIDDQGLFIHEMTHVWQRQKGICLPLARHPWCRYHYVLKPGQRFEKYGIEQQAEIVRHAFMLREGSNVASAPNIEQYQSLLRTVFI